MAENMALPQSALSNPKATSNPASMDHVDVKFAIMDVEGQLRDVALALAAKGKKQSFLYFLLPPDQLSLFTPENLLKLQRIHLSRLQARLAPDSAWSPQPERNRLLAWRSGKVRRLAPGSASAPQKPDIDPSLQDSNASASVARNLHLSTCPCKR